MYDFYDDDYYYEPSEFEEKIEELKESLRESVRSEIKEELERLRKENQELKEVRDNWEKLKEEYRNKERELQRKMLTVKQEAKKARLKELFEDNGMSVVLYNVGYNFVYKPKCNKCDTDRKIHFKSPSGRDCTEACECAKSYKKYIPISNELIEFRMNNVDDELLMWFEPTKRTDAYYDNYRRVEIEQIYNNQAFEEITINETCLFFKTKEECQKYCNYLNNKNGITDDMKEEWS